MKKYIVGIIVIILIALAGIYNDHSKNITSYGSINDGQAYNSTTTNQTFNNVTGCFKLLKTGYGTFGSVILTGVSATNLAFYDGTTTNITLETNQSTTTLAQFPVSVAAGTYTFDASFSRGLVVDFGTNGVCTSIASSTITWR